MGHSRRHCLGLIVLALAGLTTAAAAEEPLRIVRNGADESYSIALGADSASTWKESGQVGEILSGGVVIECGALRISCPRAVAWSTPKATDRNTLRLECYFENAVVQDDEQSRQCKAGFLDITTRGELKLRVAHGARDAAAPPRGDGLYQRGSALRQPAITLQQPQTDSRAGPGSWQSSNDPYLRTAVFATPDGPTDAGLLQTAAPGTPTQFGPPAPGPGAPPPGVAPPLHLPGPTPAPGGSILGGSGVHFRYFSIGPRYTVPFQGSIVPLPDGRDAIVLTGGIIVTVTGVERFGTLDLEADRVVVWTRSGTGQQVLSGLQGTSGQDLRELEFYLSGNVEMRQQLLKRVSGRDTPVLEQRTIRANEIYYNVDRNVALCFNVDYEMLDPSLLQPLHVKAEQIEQLNPTLFHVQNSEISASRLSSDPGLSIHVADATMEERKKVRRGLFGPVTNRVTGEPETVEELWVRSRDVLFYVDHTPFFYFPFVSGDARDPFGPIQNLSLGYNQVFGFQVGLTLNAYNLLGIDPPPGTRWQFNLDYLSKRGPAAGSEFDWDTHEFLGIKAEQKGELRGWYIHDTGTDQLGGIRPFDPDNLNHPRDRGYVLFRDDIAKMPYGFSLQAQLAYFSDKNFYEQFNKQEFDADPNRETFAYLKQQQSNWAWTILAEPKLARPWVSETEWLPRADFHWLGQTVDGSPFDIFSFDLNAQAGYARLRPASIPSLPFALTDVRTDTGRFDINGELSAPIPLGDFKVVPYADVDLTYYTSDLTGAGNGRAIGGGGVRASVPFSRLYPDIESDLFYLNGINHKIQYSANYYVSQSTDPFTRFPQLDRLFDDPEDQSLRDIRPLQNLYNPQNAAILTGSAVFDPQRYAIRQLVMSAIDTRDSVEVLQGDIRQRWQTKRGYPGMEHTVDWMTLDLSASFFPRADRDNFGNHFAFLQYDWVWNIGDRTSLVSTGWIDPETSGPSMFTVGAFLNRPDRTNFFLGYREIDKLNSKAVTGAVTYIFSPKYAMTLSSVYDFGTSQSLTNSLVLTRTGTDLQLSFGVSYNAIVNSFGVVFELVPNIASKTRSRYLGGLDPRLAMQ